MNSNPYAQTQVYGQPPAKSSSKKIIIIVVIVVAVLLLCCCVIAAAIVFLDPFDWDLLGRISGKTDMAAKAMPADTPLYVGINLVNFNPDKVNKTIKPFLEASGEFEENDTQGLISKLDEQLSDQIGMTITDDVIPWIGQYVGIGITDITTNPDYGDVESADFVIIVEARDKGKADEFIQKLMSESEERNGSQFSESEYKGVTIYNLEDEYSPMSFCRSGSLLLVGMPESSVKAAIDAQKGDNLKKSANFNKMANELPGSRGITLYISADQLKELAGSFSSEYSTASEQMMQTSMMDAWVDSAVSLSLVDEGIQIDVASSYDSEILTDADKDLLTFEGGMSDAVKSLPADTILYIAGSQLNLYWETYRDAIINATGSTADYEESMNMLSQQIGFDLENDLITYLDKSYALAVIPESGGIISQSAGMPIGAVGLFGTSNEGAINNTVISLNDTLKSMGTTPSDVSKGNYTLYEISDPFSGTAVSYGVGNNYLVIGTSTGTLKNILTGESTLSGNSEHKNVWNSFPNGTAPVLYVDFGAGISTIKEGMDQYSMETMNEIEPYLKPIKYLAMGNTPLSNDIVKGTIIIFIEQ